MVEEILIEEIKIEKMLIAEMMTRSESVRTSGQTLRGQRRNEFQAEAKSVARANDRCQPRESRSFELNFQ